MIEVLSVVRGWSASGQLPAARAGAAVDRLRALPITYVDLPPLASAVWQVRHDVTPYDAAFVVVAAGAAAPLVTVDRRLARAVGSEPTPEFAAMVAEEYRRPLERLDDDVLRKVAILRMEGYTTDEVAVQLGCARRTVARQLALIRRILEDESR